MQSDSNHSLIVSIVCLLINAGFPHFITIKKAGEDKYNLEMALAGYTKGDIKVTVRRWCLIY